MHQQGMTHSHADDLDKYAEASRSNLSLLSTPLKLEDSTTYAHTNTNPNPNGTYLTTPDASNPTFGPARRDKKKKRQLWDASLSKQEESSGPPSEGQIRVLLTKPDGTSQHYWKNPDEAIKSLIEQHIRDVDIEIVEKVATKYKEYVDHHYGSSYTSRMGLATYAEDQGNFAEYIEQARKAFSKDRDVGYTLLETGIDNLVYGDEQYADPIAIATYMGIGLDRGSVERILGPSPVEDAITGDPESSTPSFNNIDIYPQLSTPGDVDQGTYMSFDAMAKAAAAEYFFTQMVYRNLRHVTPVKDIDYIDRRPVLDAEDKLNLYRGISQDYTIGSFIEGLKEAVEANITKGVFSEKDVTYWSTDPSISEGFAE